MIEITPHARLVGHPSGDETRWQLQQLIAPATHSKRAIWRPVTQLMNHDQALAWLTQQAVPAAILDRFHHSTGFSESH